MKKKQQCPIHGDNCPGDDGGFFIDGNHPDDMFSLGDLKEAFVREAPFCRENTYICGHCKGEFPTDQDDDESAHAESVELWGKRGDAGGMVKICDSCFQQFMGWYQKTWKCRICIKYDCPTCHEKNERCPCARDGRT